MENTKNYLYHIHRKNTLDELWYLGNKLKIDQNFKGLFYTKLLEEDKILTEKYGNYDLDYLIAMMEATKFYHPLKGEEAIQFDKKLNRYYALRREQALEIGRKIFAPTAPSRINSLFLSNEPDLYYWINRVGGNDFQKFILELEGELFVSSDIYFPDNECMLEKQIEQSKEYWCPKIKKMTPHKDYLFQGDAKIIH